MAAMERERIRGRGAMRRGESVVFVGGRKAIVGGRGELMGGRGVVRIVGFAEGAEGGGGAIEWCVRSEDRVEL